LHVYFLSYIYISIIIIIIIITPHKTIIIPTINHSITIAKLRQF